jgi:protein O-mannosyl-transferase
MGRDANRLARGPVLSLLAIVGLALCLYASSSHFGRSHLDDDALVPAPGESSSSGGVFAAPGRSYFAAGARDHAYYRPLVSASFAFDAERDGGDLASFHETNSVVHALAGSLLWVLLRRFGYSLPVALFGALVFVAHPALAGAVAWVPGRDDMLLTVFTLLAWLFFRRANGRCRPPDRALHALAFSGALGCKETALALPLVLMLDAWLVERRPLRSLVAPPLLAIWGAVLAGYLLLRAVILGPSLGLGAGALAGALAGFRGLVSGFGELVLPVAHPVLAVPLDMPLGTGVVALALFAAALAWSGADRRVLLFALGAYALFSAPSLPALSHLLLESRLYLPAVPLALGLCEFAAHGPVPERVRLAVFGFLVMLSVMATLTHVALFREPLVLAKAVASGSPHSSLAHRNLGVAYQTRGEPELARSEYRTALSLDPEEPTLHNNLGVILMAEGHLSDAERELEAELALHPESVEAQQNLLLVRRALKR